MTEANPARPPPHVRAHERQALHASAQFAPLGSFVSSAPRTQLLGVLKQFKPHLNVRLRVLARDAQARRYRVEIDTRDLHEQQQIELWLGIKGVLTSAFPPHKPGAVERMEP